MPRAVARTYAATFDGRGLRFSPGDDPDAEVRLRTARVAIDGRDTYRADDRRAPWSILGNTAQALLDRESKLVEHHEVRGDGVEVSWVLSEAVRGEVVIDLELDGLAYAGQSPAGVHFSDRSGVSRARIGNAVLVDARGERWPIATEVMEGLLRWRVGPEVLAAATFPIALDPTVSAELGMDQPLPTASGAQVEPSVASTGSTWLVVWSDDREGRMDVYGTRVSPTGGVLDVYGMQVTPFADIRAFQPAVASNGTDFLVVWCEQDDSSAPATFHIQGARVAGTTGLVQDTSPILVSTSAPGQAQPAVSSNGTDYLVAYYDDRGHMGSIYAARVTSAGTVPIADADGIPVSVGMYSQRKPSVASNGIDYLVAWEDYRAGNNDVYGARVTAAGAVPVADQAGIPISTAANDQDQVAVSSNGTDYLVAWSDGRAGTDSIYAARVTTAGTVAVADATGIAVSQANDAQEPAVAAIGTEYMVVWLDRRSGYPDLYGARVTGGGTVPASDANGIAISTTLYNEQHPSIASMGTDYLVAWNDNRNQQNQDVFAARVTSAGVVSDSAGIRVSTSTNRQYVPAIASNGAGFLVAWMDSRNTRFTGTDVYAVRISATGAIEDVNGIAVSTSLGEQFAPSVASNGTDYLVVWTDQRAVNMDIYGARVLATGVVPAADVTGIRIAASSDHQQQPSAASNGTDYLVVWHDARCGSVDPGNPDFPCNPAPGIYGARVTAGGSVSDTTGIPISTHPLGAAPGGPQRWWPSVASNGADYLVAWTDTRNAASTGYDIFGVRVTVAGTLVPGEISISTAASTQLPAKVASNGTDYLVAWGDDRNDSGDVYAARVTAAGAVPGADATGIPVSPAVGWQGAPSVASDGTDYLLAWTDGRDSPGNLDIFGARITAAGTVHADDVAGFAISSDLVNEGGPVVAGSSGIPYLVAYEVRGRVAARLIRSPCGNGTIDLGEVCDDGDFVSGDGCSVTCSVESGYACTGAPSVCTDVNECTANTDTCDQTCVNTPGGFTCACNAGFTLATNGSSCDDIDECAVANGGCAQVCSNSMGSYTCQCGDGFVLGANGKACDDIDECAQGTDNCSPDATCTNSSGGFTCACNSGFDGDGVMCEDSGGCRSTHSGAPIGLVLVVGVLLVRRRRSCPARGTSPGHQASA